MQILHEAMDDPLMKQWIALATWSDRPTTLARAVLTMDLGDASLPTLMRLKVLARRRPQAATAVARAIAQVMIGGTNAPWNDDRALIIPAAALIRVLHVAEELLDIAKQQGFSGYDGELDMYSVVEAQAMLASAYASGDKREHAGHLAVESLQRLGDMNEEQPRSWSLAALVKHCPEALGERLAVEAAVRDTIDTIGDLSNRSTLAQAFLESTPFERQGRLSNWLGRLAWKRSTNPFSQTAIALFQRGVIPAPAQHDLLRAAAIREPEDLLLVTAGIAEVTTGKRRIEALEQLRELLALSRVGAAHVAS